MNHEADVQQSQQTTIKKNILQSLIQDAAQYKKIYYIVGRTHQADEEGVCPLDNALLLDLLKECAEKKLPLTHIHIEGVQGDDDYQIAKALTEVIANQTALKELQLYDCALCDHGFIHMAPHLKKQMQLTYLRLDRCQIGNQCTRLLQEVLTGLKSLTDFIIAANYLGRNELTSIAEALKSHPKLNQISFSANLFGDEGVKALSEWIAPVNQKAALPKDFNKLFLSYCGITNQGLKTLLEAIQRNGQIQLHTLALNQNLFTDDVMPVLITFFQTQPKLVSCNLRANAFTYQGLKLLVQSQLDILKKREFKKMLIEMLFKQLDIAEQKEQLFEVQALIELLKEVLQKETKEDGSNPYRDEMDQLQLIETKFNTLIEERIAALDITPLNIKPSVLKAEENYTVKQLQQFLNDEIVFLKQLEKIHQRMQIFSPIIQLELYQLLRPYITYQWIWGDVIHNQVYDSLIATLQSKMQSNLFLQNFVCLAQMRRNHQHGYSALLDELNKFAKKVVGQEYSDLTNFIQYLEGPTQLKAFGQRFQAYRDFFHALANDSDNASVIALNTQWFTWQKIEDTCEWITPEQLKKALTASSNLNSSKPKDEIKPIDASLPNSNKLEEPEEPILEVNEDYAYDENDVTLILETRVQAHEKFHTKVAVLPATQPQQLETILHYAKTLVGKMILLPYQLETHHWIGILIQFEGNQLKHIVCFDPLGTKPVLLSAIQTHFEKVFPQTPFILKDIFRQAGIEKSNSAIAVIEGLLYLATIQKLPQQIEQLSVKQLRALRMAHLTLLQTQNPSYFKWLLHKQKHNSFQLTKEEQIEVLTQLNLNETEETTHQQLLDAISTITHPLIEQLLKSAFRWEESINLIKIKEEFILMMTEASQLSSAERTHLATIVRLLFNQTLEEFTQKPNELMLKADIFKTVALRLMSTPIRHPSKLPMERSLSQHIQSLKNEAVLRDEGMQVVPQLISGNKTFVLQETFNQAEAKMMFEHHGIRIMIPPGKTHGTLKNKGNFGQVYFAKYLEQGRLITFVAVKKVLAEKQNLVLEEDRIHLKLSQTQALKPYVADFYGSAICEGVYYQCMEIGGLGNAYQFAQKINVLYQAKKTDLMPFWGYVFHSLLTGIHHMHQQGVTHLDISRENIVVTKKGLIKYIDFGLAVEKKGFFSSWKAEQYINGKASYFPIQRLQQRFLSEHQKPVNSFDMQKADIFALGVTLYELMMDDCLFDAHLLAHILRAPEWNPAPFEKACQEGLQAFKQSPWQSFTELLTLMLHSDETKRPTAEKLLEHPLLKNKNMLLFVEQPKQREAFFEMIEDKYAMYLDSNKKTETPNSSGYGKASNANAPVTMFSANKKEKEEEPELIASYAEETKSSTL